MPDRLAPIGISTYIRLGHLKKTVSALQKNVLASSSELFLFSDAARPGHEMQVNAVRNYLRTIDGFKKIQIVERENNDRLANNRGGMRMLLDRFDKMIFMEEDVLTTPGFLTFLNQGLDEYEANPRIFSISGYCPPIKIPRNFQNDMFLLRRFNGWGFGIWKDRYDNNRYVTPEEYEQFAADNKMVKKFTQAGGADMMLMLKAEAYGEMDAWDVKAMYTQFLKEQYTVYPTGSLTLNIGHDGTGIHCGETDKFSVVLSNKTAFLFPDEPTVDPRIVRANRIFRDGTKMRNLRARVVGKGTWCNQVTAWLKYALT